MVQLRGNLVVGHGEPEDHVSLFHLILTPLRLLRLSLSLDVPRTV